MGSRRRLMLLLAMLAAVLLLGACDEGRDANDASDRAEEQSEPDAPETPSPEDEGDVESVEPDEEEPALQIRTKEYESIDVTSTSVIEIGALSLEGPATLADAVDAFGGPSGQGPAARDRNVCEATWDDLGLTMQFFFGHPPSLAKSCREGVVAGAFMVDEERWVIVPGGLHVGDPVDRISEAFPEAEAVTLSPGVAQQLGVEAGYAIKEGAYGGELSPILFAGIRDGRVVGLAYVSLAD